MVAPPTCSRRSASACSCTTTSWTATWVSFTSSCRTWFPFRIQEYVNGHEWLARQLDHHNIKYTRVDNAFLHLGDVKRAQELADAFERVDWIHALDRYAVQVNPLLGQEEVLNSMRYY